MRGEDVCPAERGPGPRAPRKDRVADIKGQNPHPRPDGGSPGASNCALTEAKTDMARNRERED
eukprot:9286264-Pyramimonas_sp.AAC.1